ncbi:DUF1003 domain-containing protein [Candidatus Kaiserbacteria bacterium]|nr:DUF1003 domain-containing protein [Candidatus Kaiserbacteria bacterium]
MARTKNIPPASGTLRTRNVVRSFKAKANERRSLIDKIADSLTGIFGTISFLCLNALFFMLWIASNIGLFSDVPLFDPFPFGLLTMIVSLEAIFLAIIVLISQNREAKVAELREEVELYINTYAEREITKLIYLQTLLLKKNGIDISTDADVGQMLKELESDEIEKELEKQLEKV